MDSKWGGPCKVRLTDTEHFHQLCCTATLVESQDGTKVTLQGTALTMYNRQCALSEPVSEFMAVECIVCVCARMRVQEFSYPTTRK